MKVSRGSWWILAVVAACSGCAPEKLELGDAPLEEGGAGSGGTHSAGGSSATPSGGASTPGGTSMGGGGAECVSPTQHPERGFDEGVTFCACEGDDAQCVDTAAEGYVGFICTDGAWTAVNDGPCGIEKTCYSPTQNAGRALDEGATGCACDGDEAQCVNTASEGYIGFVCEDGAWNAVLDGPCGVEKTCFSPTQQPERGYDEGAVGCACDLVAPICVEVDERRIALVCNGSAWEAVEDGPCEPRVCDEDSFESRRCLQCGPAGGCAIYEVGCFTDPTCADGTCGVSCF